MKNVKKIIAIISIVIAIILAVVLYAVFHVKSSVTTEFSMEEAPNFSATTKGSIDTELEKYHNAKASYIMKDEEDNYSPMTKTEADAKIAYLKANCNCFGTSAGFKHIKHTGCSLNGGWDSTSNPGKAKCSHADLWTELFKLCDWWETGSDLNYYTKSQLIDKLEDWLVNLDDRLTIQELMEFLNDEYYDYVNSSSTGFYMLKNNTSFFCVKHGQAIGRFNGFFTTEHTSSKFNLADYITTNYTAGKEYDENMSFSAYNVTSYRQIGSEGNDFLDYKAANGAPTEEGNTRDIRSNVKYFKQDFSNMYRLSNGFGTYNTNVFSYATAYSLKPNHVANGTYNQERAQLALWAVVGSPGNGEPMVLTTPEQIKEGEADDGGETTGNVADITNSEIYNVAAALDEYESWLTRDVSGNELTKHNAAVAGTNTNLRNNPEVLKLTGDTGKVVAGEYVGHNNYEPTGTTIFTEGGKVYYRIGPFQMGDYAYAAAKSNIPVENYSGSGLIYPKLLGGIIGGKATFTNQDGGGKTELEIGNGTDQAKIVYVDPLGNATYRGDDVLNGSWTESPADYQYPYPNSIFYIVVEKSDCGSDAAILKDISFTYRQTKSDGHGWVIQSKYVRTVLKRNSTGTGCYVDDYTCRTHQSGAWYHFKENSGGWQTCTYYWNCNNPGPNTPKTACDCDGDHPNPCTCSLDEGESCSTDHGTYDCGRYCNCSGYHTATHWGYFLCSAHNHEDCDTTTWQIDKATMIYGQPFLAVHDAYVKVEKRDIKTDLGVRLTTNVTIDKYITEVDHTNTNEEVVTSANYTTYDNANDSEFSNDSRANWADGTKEGSSVKLERGDKVKYKLVLTNHSNVAVQVQVKDVLPDYCDIKKISVGNYYSANGATIAKYAASATNYSDNSGKYLANKFFITEWLEIAGGGTTVVTVELIATASDATIKNENTATIVSSNKGRDVGSKIDVTDDHTNYVRVSATKGAVVNLAQVNGTQLHNVLRSKEYFTVKSYNVVIDKYITEVRHMEARSEELDVTYKRDKLSFQKDHGINGYTESQEFNDRDIYNDDTLTSSLTNSGKINTNKYNNSVYVEYGDKVTYNIDIQNTWYANAKENNQDDPNCSNAAVKSNPYFAPNYIHVDITDTLPECYQPGTLEVKYYIYDVQHGNDSNGDNHIVEDYTPSFTDARTFSVKDLYVNPNAESMLQVSFVVNTNQTGVKYENSVWLDATTSREAGKGGSGYGNDLNYEIRNINNYYVYNKTNNGSAPLRVWSADYFMLNDYNARIDKYISYYDEKVLLDNVKKDFEEYYETDLTIRPGQTDDFKFLNPVYAEKTEKVKYTIKVFNEAEDKIIKSTGDFDYFKPATEVRVSSIKDTLDTGLQLKNKTAIKANIYGADGNVKVADIPVTAKDLGNNVYDFNIHNKRNGVHTVIEPGGYIEYIFDVEITSSNMELLNLRNKADINVLTDINNVSSVTENTLEAPIATNHSRIVTERNIAPITTSSDFIRIKDLIISGKVWLDYNKDGYMESYSGLDPLGDKENGKVNGERFMKDIVVHLYAVRNDETGVKVRTTKTDENGLYTFARNENSNSSYRTGLDQRILKGTKLTDTKEASIDKYYKQGTNEYYKVNYNEASAYIGYYVEYEYDGVLYKSTEVYSNNKNLDNYGDMINGTKNGSKKYEIDSNAKELTSVREKFNTKYQTITNNLAYAMVGNSTGKKGAQEKELEFVKDGHNSYLKTDYSRTMTARSFVYELNLSEIEDAITTAKACGGGDWKKCTGKKTLRYDADGNPIRMVHKDAWKILLDAQLLTEYQDNETHAGRLTIQGQLDAILKRVKESVTANGTSEVTNFLWLYRTGTHDDLPNTEYLKYINLGLEEREDIDVSLKKDIYEVKTTINGEEMTYSYDQLDTVGKDILNGEVSAAEGYLKNYISNKPYGLTLYESDFKYRFDQYANKAVQDYKESKSELNIEVTYKITIDNKKIENDEPFMGDNDRELYVTLQELIDVYDENFIEYNGDSEQSILAKIKGENQQLKDKVIKVAEAWYYPNNNTNATPVKLRLYNDSDYSKRNPDFSSDGYNKLYISGMNNVKIKEGENLDIYIKYVVNKLDEGEDRDSKRTLQILDKLLSKDESMKQEYGRGMENIAQVNAYSVWYDGTNKPASIVDCDSNAGNVGTDDDGGETSVDDVEYYEDTVYKTGIDITAPNSPNPPEESTVPMRTISGKVWDDSRSETVVKDGYPQYFANGIYKDGVENGNILAKLNENVEKNYVNDKTTNKETQDLLVRGAKAEYIEIVDVNGKYYEEKLINMPWKPVQNARTDASGEYLLKGLIPGHYIVRYSYGDDVSNKDMLIFNGQDYKSTKYTGVKDTEKDEDKKLYEMQALNKSDARDDEIRRLETIAYSETMVNQKAEILKGLANGSVVNQAANSDNQLSELVKNTSMYADTVTFYVKPEKLKALTIPGNEEEKVYNNLKGRIIYEELFDLKYGDTNNAARRYEIEHIDFGIEYRPETQISLNKEISRVKLITSDGDELVNLALETHGFGNGKEQEHKIIESESTGLEYTQFVSSNYDYINPSKLTSEEYQGFIFVNIETDILQGCTIELEYKFTAENNSEVDLINKNLDELRYRQNDAATNYKNHFAFIETDSDGTIYKYNESNGKYYKEATSEYVDALDNAVYSAAATARNKLYSEYYAKDGNGSVYRTKEFKTYDANQDDEPQVNNVYYGRFMSKLYYLGTVGSNDIVSSLKFDKILDYVDTGLVFNENGSERPKDKLWATATDKELKTLYVRDTSYTPVAALDNQLRLLDPDKVTYVNYNGDVPVSSNLVVSVDDRTSDTATDTINEGISKYLKPKVTGKEEASRGTIFLEVSKVIASETKTDDMQFENFAEVIQFTTQTGRRTNYATTIGNANASIDEFEEAKKEPDASATEVVTLIPPTGLMGPQKVIADIMDTAKAGVEVMSMTGLVVAIIGVLVIIVLFIIRKIKKRRIK